MFLAGIQYTNPPTRALGGDNCFLEIEFCSLQKYIFETIVKHQQKNTKMIKNSNITMAENLQIDNVADIAQILNYVKKEEQRPYFASILDGQISAKVFCKSPQYTIKSVDYLSSSELMVSVAQVGQILFDYIVRQDNFIFKEYLSVEQLTELRNNHEIYYTKMEFSFRHKIPASDYLLKMNIEGIRLFHNVVIANFRFNIGESCFGSFMATAKPKTIIL